MFSVLVIRLRSLRLLRVSGIVMRLRMFLLLITFLKASHSFRNRLLVICKNACAYTQGKREQFSGFNRTLDAINNVFRKFSAFHDETGRLNVDGMNIISNDG